MQLQVVRWFGGLCVLIGLGQAEAQQLAEQQLRLKLAEQELLLTVRSTACCY